MPKTRGPYDAEFRSQILEMVQKDGREPAELAREFGVAARTIWNWVRQAERDTGKRTDGLKTDEKEELARLRRENARLKEERDILKNYRAFAGDLLDQKLQTATVAPTEGSGRQLFGDVEPDKKHGPGMVADLRLVTPVR